MSLEIPCNCLEPDTIKNNDKLYSPDSDKFLFTITQNEIMSNIKDNIKVLREFEGENTFYKF